MDFGAWCRGVLLGGPLYHHWTGQLPLLLHPSQHTKTRPTKRDGCLYNSHRVPRCWKHAPVIRAADLFVTGRFRVTSAGGEKDAS